MQDFRELKVWQKAQQLALATYKVSQKFPADERFGLTSQVRRAAVSIAANIAEGRGLGSDGGFHRHLRIAYGSACELECELELACELGYLTKGDYVPLTDLVGEVRRMLNSLCQTVKVN